MPTKMPQMTTSVSSNDLLLGSDEVKHGPKNPLPAHPLVLCVKKNLVRSKKNTMGWYSFPVELPLPKIHKNQASAWKSHARDPVVRVG
jgi:hypothetical protein